MKTISILALALALPAWAQDGTPPPAESAPPEEAPKIISKPMPLPDGTDLDRLKDAATEAATSIWKEFVSSGDYKAKRFAILPLQKDIDGDYVALQLRNQFTSICGPQGMELYTRMDREWNTLLKEIEWGQNFGDTMDPATVQKFGRVQGVQVLVFPRILGIAVTETGGVKLRVNAQVFEVETGRQLWGREVQAVSEGTKVPFTPSEVVRNYGDWFKWGGGGLGALLILYFFVRMAARAARPR